MVDNKIDIENNPKYSLKDRFSCFFRREFYMIIPNYIFFLIPVSSIAAYICSKYVDPLFFNLWRFPINKPLNYYIFAVFIVLSGMGLLWVYSYLILEGEGGPCPPFTSKTKRLVTSGPYKYVRHPSILVKLFGVIGLGVAFRSLSFILIVIPLLLSGSLYMNRKCQEIPLLEKFGEEYEEYRKKTPAIIPVNFRNDKKRFHGQHQ